MVNVLHGNNMSPVTIDEKAIECTLAAARGATRQRFDEVIAKARELKGLNADDVAVLIAAADPSQLDTLFETARHVKQEIYGRRLVLFAPLYISNLCANECAYCAFRARNTAIKRRALTQEEIARETAILLDQGHKRVLMVAGESYPRQGFQYVIDSIATIYKTVSNTASVRRVNVNVAPLTVDEFRQLRQAGIGTYQIFQETYHRATYDSVHLAGRKRDFDWRLNAMSRAMEAGVDDVGIGALFGLYDWRFELMAILQHTAQLESAFGVGPHTISVPRLEPASGSDIATSPPHAVGDEDFRRIVAILRLAVPYTGIIMSTRETARMRRESFALGVSQISAGSRTNPGGYAEGVDEPDAAQFSLGDHRPLDEVITDIASMGFIPSFCTGCYRLGRTGADFMDMARPGDIKTHCDPNGISSFMEYLMDYAPAATRQAGEHLIQRVIGEMTGVQKERATTMLAKVRAGARDVYC